LLLEYDCIISTQVLSELSNVLSKKFLFSWKEILSVYDEMAALFNVHVVNSATIAKAIALAERYKYSYYDSLILASAREAECATLFSEDFQDGQIIDGVKVVNPFL
jgi:predicted nucleic acid-binding protein